MIDAGDLFLFQFKALEQDFYDRIAERRDEGVGRDVDVVDLLYQDIETRGHRTGRDYNIGHIRNGQGTNGARVNSFLYRSVEQAIAREHVAAYDPAKSCAPDHTFVH